MHSHLNFILNKQLKCDNYIYVFRSYIRLLKLAIEVRDKEIADLTIARMDSIDENSHIENFTFDYVVLKYQYYSVFLETNDDAVKAKEVFKAYFGNSQKVINQLRNTYMHRLVIETELLKVRYEKENAEQYINQDLTSTQTDSNHALLLIDIDHFKSVNDNYRHD